MFCKTCAEGIIRGSLASALKRSLRCPSKAAASLRSGCVAMPHMAIVQKSRRAIAPSRHSVRRIKKMLKVAMLRFWK